METTFKIEPNHKAPTLHGAAENQLREAGYQVERLRSAWAFGIKA